MNDVLLQNEIITTIEESLDYVSNQVNTARAIDGMLEDKASHVLETVSTHLIS